MTQREAERIGEALVSPDASAAADMPIESVAAIGITTLTFALPFVAVLIDRHLSGRRRRQRRPVTVDKASSRRFQAHPATINQGR